jgi:hypothetical protein
VAGLTFNVFGKDVSASKTIKNVSDTADKSSKNIGGSFKKMGSVIAGGFAAAGVGAFLKGSFDEATEAQKVGAQTAAVLKSTGGAAHVTAGQIGNLATAISNKVGIDDEAIQSGENMLLTFTNIRNEAGKGNDVFNQATQTLTDMSVATGQDMTHSAVMLGKALNDPVKGISALSRVGVTFTKQQKDQVAAMVKSGNTAGAQKIILRELAKEFGGSAAAQATGADKAKVAFGNLKEQIGTFLMPVVTALANVITKYVIPAISAAIGWVEKHRKGFQQLGQFIVKLAVGIYQNVLKPAFNAIVPVIRTIVNWVKEHRAGLERLAKFIAGFFIVAFRIGIGVFKIAIAIIRDVIKVIAVLVRAFQGIFHGLVWAWNNVGAPVYSAIKTGLRAVRDFIRPVIKVISALWRGIGTGLQWAWDHTIGPILEFIISSINTAKDALDTLKGNPNGVTKGGTVGGGPSFGHNAQGTGFWRGGPTSVNELGPESVILPRGAKIRTHAESSSAARMGGGGNTYVTVTFPTGVVLGTPAEVGRHLGKALEYAAISGTRFKIRTAVI